MRSLFRTLSLILPAALALAACGSDSTGTTGGSSGAAADAGGSTAATTVSVKSNVFSPKEVTIKAGQTVRWVWGGGTHNVVSGSSCTPDAKFSSGKTTGVVGTVFEFTFDKPGTYPYYCDPHCDIGMTGTVLVQ